MRGVPAMAANPREGSRPLRFWVKAPNTNSETGTTHLSLARARGSGPTDDKNLQRLKHSIIALPLLAG